MSEQQHCKMPFHLRVGVAPGARIDAEPHVTFVAHLDCANPASDPNGEWGAIVSFRKKNVKGLHLFAQSVLWLPMMLRARAVEAAGRDDAVLISHTVDAVFVRWGAFTPSDAQYLADQLETIVP